MWDGTEIEREQEAMQQARQPFEQMMLDGAIWFLPGHQQFNVMQEFGTRGPSMDVRIFDPHAQQSLEQATSLFEGYVMPQGQVWQKWELPDEDLMKLQHVRVWVEDKNRLLFKFRNDPKSGFTGQSHESIGSLLALGGQSMWPDIRRDVSGKMVGLSYTSDFIGQVYVKRDAQGLPSEVYFAFTWTAEKAYGKWGEKSPEPVLRAMRDRKESRKMVRFLHCVKPNTAYDPSKLDWRAKPWAGCFFCRDNKQVFEVGGYRAMPRIVSAYHRAPNEDYGRCPAFAVTPAVKAAQQMVQDLMLASEMNAMPPMGAHSDMLDQTIRYAAHEVTYGAIDHRGNRKLIPLTEPADMSGSLEMLDRLQKLIDRAFFVDMLQIRQDLKSHVTDSQLYQREEEKGILMAPLANQQTEWFSPMLDREIDLMDEMGLFDDMPGEVAEALHGGMDLLKVSYDNGLSRAQEAGAAAGYFRMIEQFTPIFQIDPSALKQFTAKYPFAKVLDNLGRINAVPASWEATDAERQAAQADDAREAQLQRILEALPATAKATHDLSAAVPAGTA